MRASPIGSFADTRVILYCIWLGTWCCVQSGNDVISADRLIRFSSFIATSRKRSLIIILTACSRSSLQRSSSTAGPYHMLAPSHGGLDSVQICLNWPGLSLRSSFNTFCPIGKTNHKSNLSKYLNCFLEIAMRLTEQFTQKCNSVVIYLPFFCFKPMLLFLLHKKRI